MMHKQHVSWLGLLGVSMLLAACKTAPVATPDAAVTPAPVVAAVPPVVVAPPATPLFSPSKWETLPEWSTLDLTPSWAALLQRDRKSVV